jgi:transcriptional regulator with XRE-family HTH domain
MIDTYELGLLLRRRRKNLGISQFKLAEKCQCDRRAVAKLEDGGSIHLDIFLTVLDALNLDMDLTEAQTKWRQLY